MYSSQVSDTYDYEYDDEDFYDSDDKHNLQNGHADKKDESRNGTDIDRKSEKNSARESVAPSERSRRSEQIPSSRRTKSPTSVNSKATSRRTKSPSEHKSSPRVLDSPSRRGDSPSRPAESPSRLSELESRLTKTPSPLFDRAPVSDRRDSIYSEHVSNTAKTNASRSAYSEIPQTDRSSRNTGFTRRSIPQSTNTIHTNKGKRARGRIQQQHAKQSPRNNNANVVVKRVLSASRNKTHALQNLIMELQSQVDELRMENRDLKRAARLQEREIKRLDNEEADLPMLLQKHSSETRVLREKLRRQKEGTDKTNEELRKKDLELLKTRDKLKKYEDMIKDRKLDERERLSQRVEKLEEELDEKQQKILELEKSIRLHEKLRNREIKEKNEKYKKVVDELQRLEKQFHEVQRRLRDKEKELEVKNIYTRSINLKIKQGGRRNSLELEDITSPVSTRKAIRSSSPPDSLMMSGSLRESQQMSLTSQAQNDNKKTFSPDASGNYNTGRDVDTLVSEQRKKEAEELKDALRKKQEELDRLEQETRDREEILRKEMESRLRRDKEEFVRSIRVEQEKKTEDLAFDAKKKHLEDEQRRENENRERLEAERIERERREDLRRQEEESSRMKELEAAERRERELEEERRRREKEKLEEEERRKKEEEERIKKEKEERNRQTSEDDDARRKKELLLARMRAIDEGRDPDAVDASPLAYSPSVSTGSGNSQKKKPIFLQSDSGTKKRDNAEDDSLLRHGPLDFSGGSNGSDARQGSGSRRGSGGSLGSKSYNFKTTDENLHNGLPAYYGSDDPSKPGSGRRRSQDDGTELYKSSFGSPSTNRKANLKLDRKGEAQANTSDANNSPNHAKRDFSGKSDGPIHGRRGTTSISADLDDPVFGSYAPTFLAKQDSGKSGKSNLSDGQEKPKNVDTVDDPNGAGFKQPRFGRRAAKGKQSTSANDGLFSDDVDGPSSGKNGYGLDYNISGSSRQDGTLSGTADVDTKSRRSVANGDVFSPGGRNTSNNQRHKFPFREEISDVIDGLDDVVHL